MKWALFCWTSSAAAASQTVRCPKILSPLRPSFRRIWSQLSQKNTVSNCGACSPALSISANRSRCWSRAAIRNAISSALRKATGISPARMRAIRTRLTPCFSSARLLRGMRSRIRLTGIVAVGFADEAPAKRPRKPLEEIVEYR